MLVVMLDLLRNVKPDPSTLVASEATPAVATPNTTASPGLALVITPVTGAPIFTLFVAIVPLG